MLKIILDIIILTLTIFLVIIVAFWLYGMITSKDFRYANVEGWKACVKEHERKKKGDSISRKQYDNYYRTGNRRYFYDKNYKV